MIHSHLTNPELTGGDLRIPIGELASCHSRPFDDPEPWFPTSEGDWVLLSDETRGKVTLQTPEVVELMLPGGGHKAIATGAFLELHPQNLTRGFRIEVIFGVDYEHQAICTQDIPRILRAKVQEGLLDTVAPDELRKVHVEFREAGASSLDYEILADFTGSAADRYEPIQRAISRLLVEACNENSWVIPFTQLTLHQADAS